MSRTLRFIAPLVLAVALAGANGAAAATPAKVAFPVGWWVGTATFTGSLSKDATRIEQHGGSAWFTLVVNRDEEVDGVLNVHIPETVTVANGSGEATISGVLTLAGDADEITIDGDLRARGTGNAMGFEFPIDVVVPPYTTFAPDTVQCHQVLGDLAAQSRGHNAALGFSGQLQHRFIAHRVEKKPNLQDAKRIADQLSSRYRAAFESLGAAGSDMTRLEAALDDVEGLLASAGGFGECGGSGALQGVRTDCALIGQFRRAVERVLATEPDTARLLELTFLAARLGIFESDWCPEITATREALHDALVDDVKQVTKDGDDATLRDIGVASAMYGLEAIYEDVNEELLDAAT